MQGQRDSAIRSFLPIWKQALGGKSGAAFGEVAPPHVRLDGSIFAAPIEGRERVWASLRAVGGVTGTLTFARESTESDRGYLEWELQDLGQRRELLGPDG